jgi:hypothetical protein
MTRPKSATASLLAGALNPGSIMDTAVPTPSLSPTLNGEILTGARTKGYLQKHRDTQTAMQGRGDQPGISQVGAQALPQEL